MKISNSVMYLAISGLALALVLGGCATVPKAERYVVAPVGSTHTDAVTNTGSFGSETSQTTTKITERTWEGKRMIAFVSQTGVMLATPEGKWQAFLGPDNKPIVSWDPPIGYEFPLEVGKTWTKSYRVTIHPRNQTIPFDNTFKVEAYEDVTVPAGTFKVFKVTSSDTVGNENIAWFSPELGFFVKRMETRTAKHPSGPGTRASEVISMSIMK